MTATIAELVVLLRHERPRRITLDQSSALTIGRSSTCDLPVRDRYLSRQHARVWCRDATWFLEDLDSANGTWVEGRRVVGTCALESGARIRIGDTEIEFHLAAGTDRSLPLADHGFVPAISLPASGEIPLSPGKRTLERAATFNALVLESLEDQPYDELIAVILERLMSHLRPSRAAIAQLDANSAITRIDVRRSDALDGSELLISRTVVDTIVQSGRAIAWHDVSADAALSQSRSLAMQGVRSVECAPMMAHGKIIGILYVDYLIQQHTIDENDLALIAQIAGFAAIRLENTRLREDALQRRLLEEEMRTAAAVQRQLLPQEPPRLEGWSFCAHSLASRGVSGDYYDFARQADGRLWIVIGDVSGKGINAALLMASLQASFRIFVRDEPKPAELCDRLNTAMKGLLPANRFITLFAARLDPATGTVEYTNAGHQPPLLVRTDRVEVLDRADILLGMFATGTWQTFHETLAPGDLLLLFTDGLAEIDCGRGEELSDSRLPALARTLHGIDAAGAVARIEAEAAVHARTQEHPDDLTLVAMARE